MSILLLALVLAVQDPPRLETCVTQRNTLEMNECAAARLELERERMDLYLAAAREVMVVMQESTPPEYGVDLPARLDASQTHFEAYADAQCRTVLETYIDGTIRTVMYLGCMDDMVRQRTHRIWLDFLSDAGTGLPEPLAAVADPLADEDTAL